MAALPPGELGLLEFGALLVVAAAVGALALRLGMSAIPAYIATGILIGPHPPTELLGLGLSLVEGGPALSLFAELGVLLLLFFLGLEFSVDQLLRDRGRIARAGAIDLVLNFGAGLLLGALVGWTLVETLFLAGIVYISSSAIVTKSLIDRGWVADPEAEPILGTLVFEDIAIAVYLALLAAVTVGGGPGAVAGALALTAAVLAGLVAAARAGTSVVEAAFGTAADEQLVLRVVGITTVVAGLALAAGVSEAVAAFFVGTAFSGTTHVARLEAVVAPLRDFFAALFFVGIGLTIDVLALAPAAGLLAAAVALTTATKLASGILSGRVYGLSATRSVRVGLGLVPRGEFSLVIAALAAGSGAGVLRETVPAFAVGYVLATSVLGTLLIGLADPITARLAPLVGSP